MCVARSARVAEADSPDLGETSPVATGAVRRAPWAWLGVTALVLLVLLVCLSEPRPGSHSFLHAVRVGKLATQCVRAEATLRLVKSFLKGKGAGVSQHPPVLQVSHSLPVSTCPATPHR